MLLENNEREGMWWLHEGGVVLLDLLNVVRDLLGLGVLDSRGRFFLKGRKVRRRLFVLCC